MRLNNEGQEKDKITESYDKCLKDLTDKNLDCIKIIEKLENNN